MEENSNTKISKQTSICNRQEYARVTSVMGAYITVKAFGPHLKPILKHLYNYTQALSTKLAS